MQGVVLEVHRKGTGDRQALVRVQSRTGHVTLQASLVGHPHLTTLRPPGNVRVLDAVVSALDDTWLQMNVWSEMFMLSQ